MCIAILTTAGKSIDETTFRRCWRNNRDGFGFAYIDKFSGKVMIDKGFLVEDYAWKRYTQMLEQKAHDRPMLIHFRARTVGDNGPTNCHPFEVKGGAMIHNGTFFRDNRATKSDSRLVAEMMYNELTLENFKKNHAQLDRAFGYSRVAFLFHGGEYFIISEKYRGKQSEFGQWNDGIWYSNGGWTGNYGDYYGDDPETIKAESKIAMYDDGDDYAIQQLDAQLWGRRAPKDSK